MSTSIPPGGPAGLGPRDPEDKYRVEKIEEDQIADKHEKNAAEASHSASFIGFMALLFKKCTEFLDLFSSGEKSTSLEAEVKEHLQFFKSALETLQKEECSENLVFLNRLSDSWNLLLADAMQLRKNTPLYTKLHEWLKEVQSYPPNEQYSLGYYLSDYAGQSWLPFPYLEMIKQLHKEYEKLSGWIEKLSDLILLLSK